MRGPPRRLSRGGVGQGLNLRSSISSFARSANDRQSTAMEVVSLGQLLIAAAALSNIVRSANDRQSKAIAAWIRQRSYIKKVLSRQEVI